MDTTIVRTTTDKVAADDPYEVAARHEDSCPVCFGGYITMTVEEDGEEHHVPVPCRRCNKGKEV